MSNDNSSLLDALIEPMSNAVKNITDKPTQNIGTTLSDIWYIVFGGISQIAEKRKLKYAYALQEFKKELEENVSNIPEENLIEPDIHIVAQALESAKYSVEKDELRHMFVKLISNSLNSDFTQRVHPIYVKIINNLTPYDALTLYNLSKNRIEDDLNFESIIRSLSILMQLGLIYFDPRQSDVSSEFVEIKDERTILFNFNAPLERFKNIKFVDSSDSPVNVDLIPTKSKIQKNFNDFIMESVTITKLGADFIDICI